MSQGGDIDTARLTMRLHRLEDYAACAAMWGDPETTRHIGVPSTPEESWARLLRHAGQWALLGYGSWVVRDRLTGSFVGEVGLKQFRRSLDAQWDEVPEIGWALSAGARGRGMATEAALAALGWADANLDAARTLCMIDPANAVSLHVAGRCGFSEIATTTYKDKPVIIFERARRPLRTGGGLS